MGGRGRVEMLLLQPVTIDHPSCGMVWQERQTWNWLPFVTFNSNSSLRACITRRALWKCSGQREGSLSSAKSSLWPCGGLGRGKKKSRGKHSPSHVLFNHCYFYTGIPISGSICGGDAGDYVWGTDKLPFKFEHARPKSGRSHHFIAFSHARGHFSISRVSPTTQSDKTTVSTPTRSNDLISQWVSLVYQKFTAICFSAVKSCQDFYHFNPEK